MTSQILPCFATTETNLGRICANGPSHADVQSAAAEMTRVLNTQPIFTSTGTTNGAIAHWQHEPLHDLVKPMAQHVIMAYPSSAHKLQRRSGGLLITATARPGTITVIPAGTNARWDIYRPIDVVQLYLEPQALEQATVETTNTDISTLLERTGHRDPRTSNLLLSALRRPDENAALDALYQQQLIDLLCTCLLISHVGDNIQLQLDAGGLPPLKLRRALERLTSDCETDVSLTVLAADAGLSRFHFCRSFKRSTGLTPHAWLRQHRLDQSLTMLRQPNASIISVSTALGYGSQTAFAAAFRRQVGLTPSEWQRCGR